MLKKYYRLTEAAEFLSSESGERITKDDVIHLAVRKDISLCVWFSGWLISCEIETYTAEPESFSVYEIPRPAFFRGYVAIPYIDPDETEVSIGGTWIVDRIGIYYGTDIDEMASGCRVCNEHGEPLSTKFNVDNLEIPAPNWSVSLKPRKRKRRSIRDPQGRIKTSSPPCWIVSMAKFRQ